MTDWVAAGTGNTPGHVIVGIAHRHASFERIHPFTDGNGRVGRLLANWDLVQADSPPMVIRFQQRDRYLRALAEGSPYSADYLRQLALSGRLRAVRHGSLWLSSDAALQEYMHSRSPRGRR